MMVDAEVPPPSPLDSSAEDQSKRGRIARLLRLPLRSTSKQEELRLLPHSVRYNLTHNNRMLGRADAETLFRNGFQNLGFYVAMKAIEEDDDLQAKLLKRLGDKAFDFSQLAMSDVEEAFDGLGESPVKGAKLAQVSRVGFDHWIEIAGQTIQKAQTALPERPLFITGSSPYISFEAIARCSIAQGQPLGILKPSNFGRPGKAAGFLITPSDEGVNIDFLPQNFARPKEAIIYDDVLRSGKKMAQVINFWMEGAEPTNGIPYFITSVVAGGRV